LPASECERGSPPEVHAVGHAAARGDGEGGRSRAARQARGHVVWRLQQSRHNARGVGERHHRHLGAHALVEERLDCRPHRAEHPRRVCGVRGAASTSTRRVQAIWCIDESDVSRASLMQTGMVGGRGRTNDDQLLGALGIIALVQRHRRLRRPTCRHLWCAQDAHLGLKPISQRTPGVTCLEEMQYFYGRDTGQREPIQVCDDGEAAAHPRLPRPRYPHPLRVQEQLLSDPCRVRPHRLFACASI
jgi:hypothetical protein